jgi:hypothetical protein
MANPNHLAKLKEGVAAWNEWRSQYDQTIPDLDHADLSDAELSKADLRRVYLKKFSRTSAFIEKIRARHMIESVFVTAMLLTLMAYVFEGTRFIHSLHELLAH